MPLIGEFHTFYWENSDTNAAPVHIGRGGYPIWQASVIVPSLFGMLGAWIDTRLEQLRWWYRFYLRVKALEPERHAVLLKTLDTLESPAYGWAQVAVRGTATTLGFNRSEAWQGLSRHMKDSPGRAENTFRHLEACRRLRESAKAANSTLSNPVQHFTAELAYQGFAIRGK